MELKLSAFCWRTMIMTVQDKRRFVEKLDFMTTPGWINGDDSREKSGLPLNTGPYKIITNLALMDFEPKSKRMRVISIHPGYTFNDVQDNCGFELLCAETAEKTHPPSMGELKILREEVDPYRYVIGR